MRRGSLADERPDLVLQWGTNNTLSPSDVSCGSHKKVWWVCDKGHTWEAIVKNRVLAGSGCPYCEHRAVLKGYNDLKTVFPKVAKTWSPKNKQKPTEVSSRSNAEVWWRCKLGHEWKARVADRTEGHGCPYCAGHRVWKGFNDLATTHPHLISEWSEKNKTLAPDTITYKNRSNVWWHCSYCGHDYQAVVYARANGLICPFCIAARLKMIREERMIKRKIDKDFTYLLPQLATIYYAGKLNLKVIIDGEALFGIPITALIPELKLAIDVCNSRNESQVKHFLCSTNKISYICMPERLPEEESLRIVREAFSDAHIHLDSKSVEDLKRIRENYIRWRKE